MRTLKMGHATLIVIALLFAAGALMTLVPNADAYKPNLVGDRTICPFAPASSAIGVLVAAGCLLVRRKLFVVRR